MNALDARELLALAKEAQSLPKVTRAAAERALRATSLAVEKRVKRSMPVDTGRARSSWGHWSAELVRPNREAGPGDAVWEEADEGLTVVQGSNVPYIEQLNNGHSAQAPAGFLDTAQLAGQVELEKALGLIDPTDPNLGYLEFV